MVIGKYQFIFLNKKERFTKCPKGLTGGSYTRYFAREGHIDNGPRFLFFDIFFLKKRNAENKF